MGSGQVGGGGWGGGHGDGGPDNNVTIGLGPPPPSRTSRAVEESESKQWFVAEGVSGSGEKGGLRVLGGFRGASLGSGGGGSVSHGLDAICCLQRAFMVVG